MIPVVIVVVAAAVAAVVTTAAIVTVVATVATVMMTNSMVIVMIGIIRKQKWVHLLQEVRRKIGSDNCHLGLLLTLLFYDVVIRLPNMLNTWKTSMVLGFRKTTGNKLDKLMKKRTGITVGEAAPLTPKKDGLAPEISSLEYTGGDETEQKRVRAMIRARVAADVEAERRRRLEKELNVQEEEENCHRNNT